MSQMGLAEEIGSSPGYIHDIETGRRNPSDDVISRIAEALKVPLPAILASPAEVAS